MYPGRRYDENFLAGSSWVQGKLKLYRFRKPHLRRRPNDPIVAEFLQFIELMEIPDACICNMDETAWRLTNGRLETLAKRGTDEVTSDMAIDERTCVTVICTITADGRKLPPWVVLKGKTDKTGKKYAQDPRLRRYIENKRLYLTYSENGWASTKVIKEYLAWFSEQMEGQWSVLVWDLYSSHRNAEIQKWAAEQHINLVFVPAGQTSTWQPLDRKIFGALKSKAQKKLNTMCVVQELETLKMTDAVWILLQSWSEISRSLVKKAWSLLIPQGIVERPARECETVQSDGDFREESEDDTGLPEEETLDEGWYVPEEGDSSSETYSDEEEEEYLELLDGMDE